MNSRDRLQSKLQRRLRSLEGLPCWSIKAGPGTGSRLMVHFGDKVPRPRPLRNQRLSSEERHFRGEISLFVESCWRLDSYTEVVAGCWDDNRPGKTMLTGLDRLIGSSVAKASAQPPGYDLTIEFSEGLVLHIFCTATNSSEAEDNYSIADTSSILSVGTRSVLSEERLSVT